MRPPSLVEQRTPRAQDDDITSISASSRRRSGLDRGPPRYGSLNWVRWSRAYSPSRASSSSWRAELHEPAVVEHGDPVGGPDGRQAVGHDDRRAPDLEPVERLLDEPLGLVVERARGLVEEQDRRVLEDGPGDGHALALPARQPRAAVADDRVVALGQGRDEVVGIGIPGGRNELLVGRVQTPVADVLGDRAAEQVASWATSPICSRRLATVTSRMSVPSTRMVPAVTSHSRGMRPTSVVLPDPTARRAPASPRPGWSGVRSRSTTAVGPVRERHVVELDAAGDRAPTAGHRGRPGWSGGCR